jgi:hypothetical protein
MKLKNQRPGPMGAVEPVKKKKKKKYILLTTYVDINHREKVKLSLCLINHCAMKTCEGVEE